MIVAEITGLLPSLQHFITFPALNLLRILKAEHLQTTAVQVQQLIGFRVSNIYQLIQFVKLSC